MTIADRPSTIFIAAARSSPRLARGIGREAMGANYGHYKNWETGALDLAAVAAHAAVELGAIERGIQVNPEAIVILVEFLQGLSSSEKTSPNGWGPALTYPIATALSGAYA